MLSPGLPRGWAGSGAPGEDSPWPKGKASLPKTKGLAEESWNRRRKAVEKPHGKRTRGWGAGEPAEIQGMGFDREGVW